MRKMLTEERINWTDVHDEIVQCNMHLISEQALLAWFDENIEVRGYIGLQNKLQTINKMCLEVKTQMDKTIELYGDVGMEDCTFIQMAYEVECLFQILFDYTNIDITENKKTVREYDFVMESCFVDWLLQYCKKDYEKFKKMCDDACGLNHLDLASVIISLKPHSVTELKDAITLIKELNEEDTRNMAEIRRLSNPRVQRIIDLINESSVKENGESIKKT